MALQRDRMLAFVLGLLRPSEPKPEPDPGVLWMYSTKDGWPDGLALYPTHLQLGQFYLPVTTAEPVAVPKEDASTLEHGYRCVVEHLNSEGELMVAEVSLRVNEVEFGGVTLLDRSGSRRIAAGAIVHDDAGLRSSDAGRLLIGHLSADARGNHEQCASN